MTSLVLADAVAGCLKRYGVTHAFGNPGVHNLALYTAFVQQGFNVVTTRHEQGAAFMCDGYARATGRPAACLVIDGPGFLNAATGIAQASSDSIPMIVVTPAPDRSGRRRQSGRLHELADQSQVSSQICREFFDVCDGRDLDRAMGRIARRFSSARPGPVHLQVPLNAMTVPIDTSTGIPNEIAELDVASMDAVREAEGILDHSRRPLILVGGGALGCGREVERLCASLDAPCLNTTAAKGLLPIDSPYRVGGSPSLPCLRMAMRDADVLLAVGTEFGETDFDFLCLPDPIATKRLIRIDIDPKQLTQNIDAEIAICGDAKSVLNSLLPKPNRREGRKWAEKLRTEIRADRYFRLDFHAFFSAIRDVTDLLVADSTQPSYYATWMYEPLESRSYFHSATGFGTLGFGIPAAIGAKLARPESRVTCLIGDGGAQFTLSELAVAVDQGLGMPFLIWDNSAYLEIEKAMAVKNILKYTGYSKSPDFRMLANAFGCEHDEPEAVEGLVQAIAQAHRRETPTVITVRESRFAPTPHDNWFL